jgi:hypothetical protein
VGSGFNQSFVIGCIVKYLNLNLPPHFMLLLNEFGMKTDNKGWRNPDRK